MHVSTEWFGNQFNVSISKKEGSDPFLVVKGCRIVHKADGGKFVSYPATKNEKTGKWWNHVWGDNGFNDHVLKLAEAGEPDAEPKPKKQGSRQAAPPDDFEDDIPFAPISKRMTHLI